MRSYRRAWAVSIVLALLSVVSFLDRQVLAVLVSDIRSELLITDVQLGWLMGPAFFIVYNVTLIPAAFVVDRWNRKWLITLGVVIWSVLTVGSGFAQSYEQLLWLRAGVAFGEALLGPAAISMIGDMFERNDRPLPTAAYVAGSTVGSTGSALMSAMVLQWVSGLHVILPWIGAAEPWRLTLIGVGVPGLVLALVFVLASKEPPREDLGRIDTDSKSLTLTHLKSYGWFYTCAFLGLALLLMNLASIALWAPTFFARTFDLTAIEAGYRVGLAALVGGVSGTIVLPAIIRYLIRSKRIDAMVNLVMLCIVGAAGSAYFAGNSGNIIVAMVLIFIFMFCAGAVGIMPTLIVQLYTPSNLRGRLSAVVFFLIYLLAFGLAPVLVPMTAEYYYVGEGALGEAIGQVALASGLLSLVLFASARSGFHSAERDVST
ncbi:MFS transporter [Halioglobus maricola]|uniref:MFS transporter n=1 Tax=Halioglobus maricola TaxID=2601894 RepID=UPI00147822B5|nr:MFS transporter [Halioglobus maricola]